MGREFDKAFGITRGPESERKAFVNRINFTILSELQKIGNYSTVFHHVCYDLGLDADNVIREYNVDEFSDIVAPPLTYLTNNDFMTTLEVIHYAYRALYENQKMQAVIDKMVQLAISQDRGSLGIVWSNGMFYPQGAKELDRDVLSETLGWLKKYPTAQKAFGLALEAAAAKRYNDVVTNSYVAFEGLVRAFLGNDKNLENNRDEFVRKVEVSAHWSTIIHRFFHYSNDYGRHGSEKRADIKPHEAEAYLYLAGVLCRLVCQIP